MTEPWKLSQVRALTAGESEAEVFGVASDMASALDFSYCGFRLRMPLPVSRPKTFKISNFSLAKGSAYVMERFVRNDSDSEPIQLPAATGPMLWSARLAARRPIWDEAHACGLQVGWAQQSFDAQGVGGLLTLARSRVDISPDELDAKTTALSWLAQATHASMARLLVPKLMPDARANLTGREVAVLRWTADGKTSSEIADIMAISDNTVNFHIKNALSKLNATNKTAAVVKAAKMGLL